MKTDVIKNTPQAWSTRAFFEPTSHQAAMWSEQGQRQRFEQVLAALSPRFGETLLDYGCGTGELTKYLRSDTKYIGYDWSAGMITRAKQEHPGFDFRIVEPNENFDLLAVIGTFNLADNWSNTQTWNRLHEMVPRMRRGMAVSLYAGDDVNCLYYTAREVHQFISEARLRGEILRSRANDLLFYAERP